MKKIILGAAALTLLFTACKKDDNGSKNNASIVGTWKPTTQVIKKFKNGTQQSAVASTRNPDEWIKFTADGKVYNHYFSDNTKWIDDTSGYKVDGNTLYLIYERDTPKADILTLTSNQLVLKNVDTDIWAGDTLVEETTTTLSR